MNDDTPPPADTVESLRARIDAIDASILDLVEQRMQVAQEFRAVKPHSVGAAAMRPSREVEILRTLIARGAGKLDPDLVIDVWRPLLSASLKSQTHVEAAVAGAMDPVRLHDLVRRYFGHSIRLSKESDARAALSRAAENASVIAAVPWPGNNGAGMWWPCLTENRYANLMVVAGLPLRGEPEAALLAQGGNFEFEAADHTLAIAFDPHHRLTRALNQSDLTGRELGRASEKLLFALEGFVSARDPRLTRAIREGLEGLRVIGSFSRL
jgi:chorismate mutase